MSWLNSFVENKNKRRKEIGLITVENNEQKIALIDQNIEHVVVRDGRDELIHRNFGKGNPKAEKDVVWYGNGKF